jgi:hypothetical protein
MKALLAIVINCLIAALERDRLRIQAVISTNNPQILDHTEPARVEP